MTKTCTNPDCNKEFDVSHLGKQAADRRKCCSPDCANLQSKRAAKLRGKATAKTNVKRTGSKYGAKPRALSQVKHVPRPQRRICTDAEQQVINIAIDNKSRITYHYQQLRPGTPEWDAACRQILDIKLVSKGSAAMATLTADAESYGAGRRNESYGELLNGRV